MTQQCLQLRHEEQGLDHCSYITLQVAEPRHRQQFQACELIVPDNVCHTGHFHDMQMLLALIVLSMLHKLTRTDLHAEEDEQESVKHCLLKAHLEQHAAGHSAEP